MADSFKREDVEIAPVAAKVTETPIAETPSVPAVVASDVVAEPTADEAAAEPSEEATAAAGAEAVIPDGSTKPTKINPIPKRIEELLGDNKALRDYGEYWRQQALKGVQPPATTVQPVAQVVEEAPTLESCEFDTAKWTKQMAVYTNKQIQAGVQAALQGDKQQQSDDAVKASYEAKCEAFAATHPDFAILVKNPALPTLHKDAAELLVKSDLAAELTDHLARHPDQAVRIARSTPAQQAAAIGRLEGELKPKVVPKVPRPTTSITQAPSPPSKTATGASPSKPQAEMSMDEWVANERSEEIAKRNARKAGRMR